MTTIPSIEQSNGEQQPVRQDHEIESLIRACMVPLQKVRNERDALFDERDRWDKERDDLIDEINTLRARVYAQSKQIEDRDQRIFELEQLDYLNVTQHEGILTEVDSAAFSMSRASDRIRKVVMDAAAARRREKPIPDAEDFVPDHRADLVARLENDLNKPLAQPEEVLEDEQPETDGDEKPIPAFLRQSPTIVGGERQ